MSSNTIKPRWYLLNPDPLTVQQLSQSISCSPLMATLLINRGIQTPGAANTFLNATLQHLRSPMDLKDMDVAVERVAAAISNRERILIFGDYDVDGITATALLVEFLQHCGATVTYYIPHRLTEGYGLKEQHIQKFTTPRSCDLIITVDCGSSSHAAVAKARAAGMDVIITDHHRLDGDLPAAVAVVNPKRPDCHAGLENLAGVGVAFYLIIALRKHLREAGFWQSTAEPNLKLFCDLVALGTVADMVPLCDENRIFSRAGLEIMQQQRRSGLLALQQDCGIDRQPANTVDISFRLAPRLNAAGRIEHACMAVQLLMQHDPAQARTGAQLLSQLNGQRQVTEQAILDEINGTLQRHPEYLAGRGLVMFNPHWHQGVLGIVAARLMRRHFRPVVLLGLANGRAKGSARSIPGFDLYQGLTACADWLHAFGGHAMAAGLEIEPEKIDAFRRQFNQVVASATTPDDFIPLLTIDSRLPLSAINADVLTDLNRLKPYGEGNPEPVFVAENVRVLRSDIVGKKHRRMLLQADTSVGSPIEAIQFNIDTRKAAPSAIPRLVFRLQQNQWQGRVKNQLVIEDYEYFPCKNDGM